MEDVIQVNDQWYISATSHRADVRTQVLKQGDTFAVFDRVGEFGKTGVGEKGLYHRGTRHLSKWELLINGRHPMLLNSTMKEDNSLLVVELTTPDIHEGDQIILPKGTLHLSRAIVVQEGTLYEHLRMTNYSQSPIDVSLEYHFGADFRDIFEVRGARREQRGELLPAQVSDDMAILSYRGLDNIERRTGIAFDGHHMELDEQHVQLRTRLEAGLEQKIHATVSCTNGRSYFCLGSHSYALRGTQEFLASENELRADITTSNEQFNDWVNRSVADLQMLITDTVFGRYPYAGVPWFSTPFGRDGLWTALQTLWVHPELARGVLSFLAGTQATEVDPMAEAEPGKILHEMREGEMAALGEIPFRRYYGTIDATPLFIMLAGKYYHRTGDRAFIEFLWKHIELALTWIDDWGDIDGDGFVEYQRHNARGLVQQGWKDSDDSIFHADGSPAEGPIALCEVQGYVYAAKLLAAELAGMLGDSRRSEELRTAALDLKRRFHRAFWLEPLKTYALALDGRKQPCAVLSSNPGHLLYTGIADERHAEALAATLTNEQAFNGWGIRTISEGQPRYNPMSYHNGSIWPHDTAIMAAGLARYGFSQLSLKLMTGLFDASIFLEISRLPELFCGFARLPGHAPTLYPVACSPQAWAAGAVFMLLEACLGISFAPHKPQIRLDHPALPDYLQWVKVRNLRIGDGFVDLALRRHPRDVGLNVERKEGDIDVAVIA